MTMPPPPPPEPQCGLPPPCMCDSCEAQRAARWADKAWDRLLIPKHGPEGYQP